MEKPKINTDLKIMVLGNSETGKSNFVTKYAENSFDDSYKPTIVSKFGFKIFEFEGLIYRIQLWDLSGKDKDNLVTKIFAKDSHGFIIVADATNPKMREE